MSSTTELDVAARVGGASQLNPVTLVRRGLRTREPVGDRFHVALRIATMAAAVVGIAVGAAAMLKSGLGAGPADVFIAGIALHSGLTHGTAALLFSATLFSIAAIARCGVRPATAAMALSVGPTMNVIWAHIPQPDMVAAQVAQFTVGMVMVAVAVGAVIQTALGAGSLELITLKLAARTGRGFAGLRIGIEMSFAVVGIVVGGTFGAGTVVFALLFGPLVALSVAGWGRVGHHSSRRLETSSWSVAARISRL